MIASKDLRRPGRLNPVCRVRRLHASMVAPGLPSPIRMGLGRTDAMAPGWHASTPSGQSVKVPSAPVSEFQEVNLTPFRWRECSLRERARRRVMPIEQM